VLTEAKGYWSGGGFPNGLKAAEEKNDVERVDAGISVN
jgi:hypothetical protein